MDEQIVLRPPTSQDALPMQSIAKRTRDLMVYNSYTYALMARHFQETSMVAECKGRLCGFVIGYYLPDYPHSLFVSQAGMVEKQGIGKKLLIALIMKRKTEFIEAMIVPENQDALELFQSVASHYNVPCVFEKKPFFSEDELGEEAECGHLIRVGPF